MSTATVGPVAIKIDDDIKARLKRLADARHRTPHGLMREAISQYVEREDRREAFRQDTLKAWEEYRTAVGFASGSSAISLVLFNPAPVT